MIKSCRPNWAEGFTKMYYIIKINYFKSAEMFREFGLFGLISWHCINVFDNFELGSIIKLVQIALKDSLKQKVHTTYIIKIRINLFQISRTLDSD